MKALLIQANGNNIRLGKYFKQPKYELFFNNERIINTIINNASKCVDKVFVAIRKDFEIKFDNNEQMLEALNILKNLYVKKNKENIFKEIEERNKSLFVTLSYPHEIKKIDEIIYGKEIVINFYSEVVFLAIKNGIMPANEGTAQ